MGSAKSAWCCASLVLSFGCTDAHPTPLRADDDTPIQGEGRDGGSVHEDNDGGANLDVDASVGAMQGRDSGAKAFALTSTMLENGGDFAAKYTCNGEDISPPLSWKNMPEGTRSFTLVFTDLDDHVLGDPGPFVQWALFNIPQALQSLPEGIEIGPMPGNVPGASQVRAWSAFGGVVGGNHYLGPCPSERHRYELALYALDVETLDGLDTSKQPREIANRVESLEHVLGVATLSASYTPPP